MMNDVDDEVDDNDNIETERSRLRQLEIRRRVDRNDPSLLCANVGEGFGYSSYIPQSGDWGECGASIGRNTFIEEVCIKISHGDFSGFSRGFVSNRSVKSLTIYCEALGDGEALGALLPFFLNNSTFKSLHIRYAEPTCLRALASILRQFDTITVFSVYDCEDHDDDHFDEYHELYDEFNDSEDFSAALSEVFEALAGHSGLTTLRLEQSEDEGWPHREILRNGWESLTALLSKTSSSLTVLELDNTLMDNLGASILAAGILENASLKEFALNSTQQMTLNGWDVIFAALKRSACTLEKLKICMSQRMEDDVI
jgi:hypothetical protein